MTEQNLEIVNWPESEYAANKKFIQVEVDGRRYLRVQDEKFESSTHLGLLGQTLNDAGIPIVFENGKDIDGKDESRIAPKDERYNLYGAGHANFSLSGMYAVFGANSRSYGLGFNGSDLEEIRRLKPGWEIRSE